MDETQYLLRNSNNIVNVTTHMVKTPDDMKYFYIAIASLVVFFLISIITTILLCVTLKNEPLLWEAGDIEKPPEYIDDQVNEFQETMDVGAPDDDINI